MKTILLLSCAAFLTACEPMPAPDSGLDAAPDVQAVTDAGSEASSDALPPHVDGGGID